MLTFYKRKDPKLKPNLRIDLFPLSDDILVREEEQGESTDRSTVTTTTTNSIVQPKNSHVKAKSTTKSSNKLSKSN